MLASAESTFPVDLAIIPPSTIMSTALRRSVFNIARTTRVVAAPNRTTTLVRSAFVYRSYSAAAGLSREDVQTRVLDVLKSFEKVDPSKVSKNSYYTEVMLTRCY